MLYLRQFKNLELVNLAGNPLCREANYKSYLLSNCKNLKYLDYTRITSDDVTAAFEQHQDEMLDLKEKEDLAEEERRVALAAEKEESLMKDANLQGVDSFFDNLIKDDPDWIKLAQAWHLPLCYVCSEPCACGCNIGA
jgi:CRISPR/Cas system-associated protein Cas7 (RAMP superfamily)